MTKKETKRIARMNIYAFAIIIFLNVRGPFPNPCIKTSLLYLSSLSGYRRPASFATVSCEHCRAQLQVPLCGSRVQHRLPSLRQCGDRQARMADSTLRICTWTGQGRSANEQGHSNQHVRVG